MKGELHMIGATERPVNKHIIFVDTKKEGKIIDTEALVYVTQAPILSKCNINNKFILI